MATDKYEMETAVYSTAGWNAIYKAAIELLDSVVHTWMPVVLGEDVTEGETLYLQVNGSWFRALSDGIRMPVLGIAIEDGIAGATIRIQRDGPITVSTWSLSIGVGVWLSSSTRGGITQTKPANAQFLGIATGTTEIDLRIDIEDTSVYGTTTTTSSSTTTTTTTA